MRNAFIKHLTEWAGQDDSIFLVVGDLGFTVIEPFVEQFPDRFLNAGVAEQNMTSVACGLAREGYKVFTYSIGNFTTLRCLEQIRDGVCYHQLPVCVVSVGGGFMYGALGPTHHATEDIGILRTLPHMRVFAPFSQSSACCALDEAVRQPGPAYIRLGREGQPVEGVDHNGLWPIQTNEAQSDHLIINVGQISERGMELANKEKADVYSVCRVNPLPAKEVKTLIEQYKTVTVIEDHQGNCGVRSAIAEVMSPIRGIHVKGQFSSTLGMEAEIRDAMMFDQE